MESQKRVRTFHLARGRDLRNAQRVRSAAQKPKRSRRETVVISLIAIIPLAMLAVVVWTSGPFPGTAMLKVIAIMGFFAYLAGNAWLASRGGARMVLQLNGFILLLPTVALLAYVSIRLILSL